MQPVLCRNVYDRLASKNDSIGCLQRREWACYNLILSIEFVSISFCQRTVIPYLSRSCLGVIHLEFYAAILESISNILEAFFSN